MRSFAWPAVLLAATAPTVEKTPAAKAIDAPCDATARLDDAHKKNARLFGDLSDAVRPKAGDRSGKWRTFKDAAALKALAAEEGAPNTQAFVWSGADGTMIAFISFASDSGDWSDDVEYCFRPDGSLARAEATLVNVTENVSGQRTTYFAADGRVLLEHEEASEGTRPLRGPHKMAALDKTIVYPTVSSLPFFAPAPSATPAPAKAAAPPDDLSPADVQRQVRRELSAVEGCYERALAKTPRLGGKVVLRWTIERDGSTKAVAVESDTLSDPLVGTCIADLARKWRFSPAPRESTVDVSFPFVFQANDRDAGTNGPQPRPTR